MRKITFPFAIVLMASLFATVALAGCQGEPVVGKKPGDDLNPVMSDQQKAIITQHKNRVMDQNR